LTLYSWDKRIRRAEQLADDYPASAEVLRFYAQVARFQQGVYERLKRQPAGATDPAVLEPDFPPLLRLIQRIGPAPLAGRARELERENRSFRELLAIDAPELLFFVRVLLQPLMECAPGCSGSIAEDGAARCPACGEWPQTAVLRGEGDGGKRWLMCSLCSSEWEFRRILCPNCGEENHDRLPVFTSAAFEHVRIEACDRCHTYIKSIDLTKNGLAIPCVDDLASLPLDLWADQAGYAKLQRNILGL
jgi:FdhE protein